MVRQLNDEFSKTLQKRSIFIYANIKVIHYYYMFYPFKVLNDIIATKDGYINVYQLFRARVVFNPICSYQWNQQNIIGGKLVLRH